MLPANQKVDKLVMARRQMYTAGRPGRTRTRMRLKLNDAHSWPIFLRHNASLIEMRIRMVLVILALGQLAIPSAAQDNGIGVGPPKVFDTRTLSITPNEWNQRLRDIQFVDQKATAGRIGRQ